MTDNELLLAISKMMDEKLKPLETRMKSVEVTQENEILPRLRNIESCYTDTYKRYQKYAEKMESAFGDIKLLKKVVTEHSMALQNV